MSLCRRFAALLALAALVGGAGRPRPAAAAPAAGAQPRGADAQPGPAPRHAARHHPRPDPHRHQPRRARPPCGPASPRKVDHPDRRQQRQGRRQAARQPRSAEGRPARLPRRPPGDARGMSNLRLFCIDDLPQVNAEAATRKKEHGPGACRSPASSSARPTRSRPTTSRSRVKAGQRLSFEVLGRRLGSAFDPQLTLFDARTGRECRRLQQRRPRPADRPAPDLHLQGGRRLPRRGPRRDLPRRGGLPLPAAHRRLPLRHHAVPMAAKRGSKVAVHFAGPHVEGVAPVEVTVPADPTVERRPGGAEGGQRPVRLAGVAGRQRPRRAGGAGAEQRAGQGQPRRRCPAASRAASSRRATSITSSSPPRRGSATSSRRGRRSITRRPRCTWC